MKKNVLNDLLNVFTDKYLSFCSVDNEAICKEAVQIVADQNKSKGIVEEETVKNNYVAVYLSKIADIANKKAVYCPNRSLGCREIMPYHEKQNHCNFFCQYNSIYCEICDLNYIKGENTCPNCIYLKNINKF